MLMIHPDVEESPLARVNLNHQSLANNDPAARGRFPCGGGGGVNHRLGFITRTRLYAGSEPSRAEARTRKGQRNDHRVK